MFKSRSNLVENAAKLLDFLHKVNKHPNLYGGNFVTEALYRYEKFWLELASKHGGELLLPPLDIQWVWYVHMLAPAVYEEDCKAVTGKVVDTRFPRNSKESELGSKFSRQYWTMMYPNEKFEIELDYDWSKVTPRTCSSKISYDIRSAITRERMFWYNVSLPHYSDKKFLRDALLRYKTFLQLKKMNPDIFLVPCYDMELIRHTHQVEPCNYADEMKAFGLSHENRINDHNERLQTTELLQKTKELWSETFDDSLSKEGCMSRADAPKSNDPRSPSSFTKDPSLSFTNTANTYSISLMKVELSDCNARSFNLAIYKKYRNLEDKKVLSRNGPKSVWSGRPPSGIKNFHYDSSKCTHLSAVLTKSQGLYCFKDYEILDRYDFPVVNDTEIEYSSSKELNYSFPLMLEDNIPNAVTVQLKMTRFPLKSGPLVVRLQLQPFSTNASSSADVWKSVPLPMTNPARPEMPNNVHTATHRLLTHHNKVAYKVQVIHGVMEGMSAVLVRNENDTGVISEAHLIGPDQLPIRDQLEKPEKCACLSDQRTERAFLIRDAEGDWGVCVGRWAAYRKNEDERPTLEKKVGEHNPGFLHLRFYDLRKEKMKRLYVPTREKKTNSFCFDFNIGDLYVDMEEGHFIVSKNCTDHAQNIALAFSVCMLFSLCQPFPRNFVHSREVSVDGARNAVPTNADNPDLNNTAFQQNPATVIENNLPPPKYNPLDRNSPRKKVYSNNNLVLLNAVGYWFYASCPVYYETELTSDFDCDYSLAWNKDKSEGVYCKGVDDADEGSQSEDGYDNETMTIEEATEAQ